jgi:hypothetical protein
MFGDFAEEPPAMADLPDALREYRVRIIPTERAGPQPTHPANIGRRTKFGGIPNGIQPADDDDVRRQCPQCFGRMHFVAQIDSFEHKDENNPNRKDYDDVQFMFGDVGMIYVWFCFNCLTPQATFDSY